jgi:hypothetical protein
MKTPTAKKRLAAFFVCLLGLAWLFGYANVRRLNQASKNWEGKIAPHHFINQSPQQVMAFLDQQQAIHHPYTIDQILDSHGKPTPKIQSLLAHTGTVAYELDWSGWKAWRVGLDFGFDAHNRCNLISVGGV